MNKSKLITIGTHTASRGVLLAMPILLATTMTATSAIHINISKVPAQYQNDLYLHAIDTRNSAVVTTQQFTCLPSLGSCGISDQFTYTLSDPIAQYVSHHLTEAPIHLRWVITHGRAMDAPVVPFTNACMDLPGLTAENYSQELGAVPSCMLKWINPTT